MVFYLFLVAIMNGGDWQNGKRLSERMFYMLKQQLMCDVTFHLGPDRAVYKAHRCMLASTSPVFYSMFEGPMAEQGEINIPDIEVDIFQQLIRQVLALGSLQHAGNKLPLHTKYWN